jgi:5-methyltetrahydrofolate corrinoid/iron sulfur protein methyltransferase
MLLIAENLQITTPYIQQALEKMDPAPIKTLVQQCVNAGANGIDINSGPLTRRAEEKMDFLVETVQSVTDLPILIDTTNPKAIEAGLEANRYKAIINGFSLERSKRDEILPLAVTYEVDIIGYLLHPDSRVPVNAVERLEIAIELHRVAIDAGLDPDKMIVDPVVVPLLWENGTCQAREVLEAIRQLPEVLGFKVRTIAGLSNLTTGRGDKRKKRLIEQTYLPMLAAAGLDMCLLNVLHSETVAAANACKALLQDHVFAYK